MIEVSYIFHSGFLVETSECYYLFDYYKGNLPELDREKPVLVFASHSHADHYNPKVFYLLRSMGMKNITAILAKDIPQKRYPDCLAPTDTGKPDNNIIQPSNHNPIPVIKAYHSREYSLPCHTHLQTLLSTDSGVAFFLTCPEGSIYHGGDLNDWIMEDMPLQEQKQMTGSYRASVAKLKGKTIDIAFLPLDPRLGKYYANGFLYFLHNINVKQAYPMHYWEQPEIIRQFLKEHPEYAGIICMPKNI